MSVPDIHKNDVGTELVVAFVDEAGVAIDITTASPLQIILRKQGATTGTPYTAVIDTVGTTGLAKYVTQKVAAVYDLDTVGDWQIQGYAKIGTDEWYTEISTFKVAGNLI